MGGKVRSFYAMAHDELVFKSCKYVPVNYDDVRDQRWRKNRFRQKPRRSSRDVDETTKLRDDDPPSVSRRHHTECRAPDDAPRRRARFFIAVRESRTYFPHTRIP